MKILILGGDGYLGWPTAMYFSKLGHEVSVVDNYLKRKMMQDENLLPLFPVPKLEKRIDLWGSINNKKIEFYYGNICDWTFINSVFDKTKPDVIIHYAEQPSAPYSMINYSTASLTLNNNLTSTLNVIFAIKENCPDAHLIKLGTMGEYGTPDIDIEEGWLEVEYKGRKNKFLYPRQGGSLYHTTKIMDTDLLWFYVRVWGLKVTDLMQGPVYGIFTDETEDTNLLTRFNYDEIFGTVLNRFIVQAVKNYPLTVYGKGGQTRGYLNIKDTLNCIRLSLENTPKDGELRIFNQFTETFSVIELAEKVKNVSKLLGINVEINKIENPRIELEEHYYNPKHTHLIDLGLEPNFLTDDELVKMIKFVNGFKDLINTNLIFKGTKWR